MVGREGRQVGRNMQCARFRVASAVSVAWSGALRLAPSLEIRDTASDRRHSKSMSTAPSTRHAAAKAASSGADVRVSAELEAEIVEAMAEFDRGEYIELTREQLDEAASTGEWPWPKDEPPG